MGHPVVRKMLEDAANKNSLSGDLVITLLREYDEECSYSTEAFKDEVFENSDLSYYIAKVLEHLPISHNSEIYNAYISYNNPAQFPDKYLWNVGDGIFTLDEITNKFIDDPLYDVDIQNVSDIGNPLYDVDMLSEFINENLNIFREVISWNIKQGDYNQGNVSVSAKLELTIDQIMNLPDYALSGWDYHIKTKAGTIIIEG